MISFHPHTLLSLIWTIDQLSSATFTWHHICSSTKWSLNKWGFGKSLILSVYSCNAGDGCHPCDADSKDRGEMEINEDGGMSESWPCDHVPLRTDCMDAACVSVTRTPMTLWPSAFTLDYPLFLNKIFSKVRFFIPRPHWSSLACAKSFRCE